MGTVENGSLRKLWRFSGEWVKPDEYTYGLLMDTCFKEGQLVKSGKLDDAKSFFGMMASKLKMDDEAYKFIMRAFSEAGRLDEMLKIVDVMLDEETVKSE
ncbi:hypothetical protein F2Q70_00040538 [Brassica cretica]|uniref:Pentacotripeptide-repeat region of PRORP domain-containing protein n=1 Tax=Brassica cretica TaxID=69181 RepID=A0A8S9K907_BRACR|nr:hypothetical protein F2Q70_00040538 [Brassica cretica]